MSEKLREALSAAMDGEADAFELRRVLDEASGDALLREEWHRLHLIRDTLRNELGAEPTSLRREIRAQMEGLESITEESREEIASAAQTTSQNNWSGRLTGTAVALVVAALVVFNADLFSTGGDVQIADNNPVLEAANLSAQAIAPGDEVGQLVMPVMSNEVTQADLTRMDRYRMQHYQQNALNKAGAVSLVRMATFRQMKSDRARAMQERGSEAGNGQLPITQQNGSQ